MTQTAKFTLRDLALVVPDTVDGRTFQTNKDGVVNDFKPTIDKTKEVTRYWAGKAPKWAPGEEDAEEREDMAFAGGLFASLQRQTTTPLVAVPDAPDDRLARIQNARSNRLDRSAAIAARKTFRAEVIEAAEPAERSRPEPTPFEAEKPKAMSSEQDDDEIAARRARVRAKMLARQKAEEEAEAALDGEMDKDQDGAAEDSSEWETDTSDEETELHHRTLRKPNFVPKKERLTLAEQKAKDAEAAAKRKKIAARKEDRVRASRKLVVDEIQLESERGDERNASDDDMPDDADDVNDNDAFEAWKLRELKRIQFYKSQREVHEKEKEATERRRNMTDAQRAMDDRMLIAKGVKEGAKPKAKWKFLQKYYHKGAFYMDDTSITEKSDARKKTYDAPTGEDKFDKSILPKVMQVKKFGRSGQTKWTHLVDQDTTSWEDPWMYNDALRARYNSRMAGVGDLDMAGRVKRKPRPPPGPPPTA